MAITDYRIVTSPVGNLQKAVEAAIAEGWQPYGQPLQAPTPGHLYQPLIKGVPAGSGGGGGEVQVIAVADLSDATELGKDLLLSETPVAVRSAIGAGTSNLALGTAAGTALAGNTAIPTIPAKIAEAEAVAGTATTQRTVDAAVLKAAVLAHAPTLPAGTTNDQVLKWSGTAWVAAADSNTTYTAMTAAAAQAGTASTANTISPAVLAAEIDRRVQAAIAAAGAT